MDDDLWNAISYLPDVKARGEVGEAISAISDLDRYANTFASNLKLFDFVPALVGELEIGRTTANEELKALICSEYSLSENIWRTKDKVHIIDDEISSVRGWSFIAARDGAMTIYHFGRQLDITNKAVATCSVLDQTRVKPVLAHAGELFRNNFPFFARIRHAVGHEAANRADPKKHWQSGKLKTEKSSIDAGGDFLFSHNLENRTFSVAYEKETYKYDVSIETLGKLKAVVRVLKESIIAGCHNYRAQSAPENP